MELNNSILSTEKGSNCKGREFRCQINEYYTNGTAVQKVVFKLLKRRSCPGCAKCGWLDENLGEVIENRNFVWPDNPKNGALYRLATINESRDWETGIIDEYDLTFEKLE